MLFLKLLLKKGCLENKYKNMVLLTKGLQWAGPGHPAQRSKAHGPAWGGPLSPLTGQWAGPFIYLRPVGPQAGRAWRACGPG